MSSFSISNAKDSAINEQYMYHLWHVYVYLVHTDFGSDLLWIVPMVFSWSKREEIGIGWVYFLIWLLTIVVEAVLCGWPMWPNMTKDWFSIQLKQN